MFNATRVSERCQILIKLREIPQINTGIIPHHREAAAIVLRRTRAVERSMFDALRGDPRFQELCKDKQP